MNNEDLPKCDCGIAVGLSLHDDRWWCPACLWKEIERLREALAPFAKAAQYMTVGKGWDPKEIGIWTDNASGCRLTVATFQAAAAELEPEGGDS